MFGLRTQFSCPLDSFVLMDDNYEDMEAMSIVSQCLGLKLGSFPILGLQSHLYIFDKCNNTYSPFCSILDYTDTFITWSTFPPHVQSVSLGNFITLLPISDSNRTALYATFSKNTYSLQAKLFNLRLSLFDVDFSCTATIDDQQLYFEKVVDLFEGYSTKLSGKIKQVNDWNNAPIHINGLFSTVSNNITDRLCKQINKHFEMLYNRSTSKVSNAEKVYNRTVSQYSIAQLTYKEIEDAKNESNDFIQKTEVELLTIKNNIASLTSQLQITNNNFQNLINRTCRIKDCPELCVPKQVCQLCQQNITTSIQGSCSVPCVKATVTPVIVGTRTVTKQHYVPLLRCPTATICLGLTCSSSRRCSTIYINTPLTYDVPIVQAKVGTTNTTCNKPCAQVHTSVPLQTQCCGKVGCGQKTKDVACLRENQQCQHQRNTVYAHLNITQRDQIRISELLDDFRMKEAVTNLRLRRYKAHHILNERRFNMSKIALNETQIAFTIASGAYQLIKQQHPLDLLEKIKSRGTCGSSPSAYIEIKSVSFNTTIITDSPTILELNINISIHPHDKSITEGAYINFNSLNTSLQNIAADITDNVVLHRRRKRQYRNTANKLLEDANYFHFQRRCTDIKNILSYVKSLNTSIYSIVTIALSSISDIDNNINEILDLIDIVSAPLNTTSLIISNVTSLNESTDRPNVIEEAIELVKEHLLNNQFINNTFHVDLFKSWQAKMEYLHNETKRAAGLPCLSFSDCLQEVVDTVEDLVNGIPVINFEGSRLLAIARENLLDLALLQNFNIFSAVESTHKIYKLANDPLLYNYWCANPPIVTIQPSYRFAARENTTIKLACEVEVEDYSTFIWKKNSAQIPNQRGSTLILSDVRLSDSGNYTCVVTNQVSSITSTNVSVEVQQFPSFFLQPENLDAYSGDMNGAIFKSNATGFPYPGYRWYFKQKGTSEFGLIPDQNQNELTIVSPLADNEGFYYCEAFNEQGILRSRIVTLTVLESTVVQVARTAQINFIASQSDVDLDIISLGSGEDGVNNDRHTKIILSPTEIITLQEEVFSVLPTLISFGSTAVKNVTVIPVSSTTISISVTLYSENISYPNTSLSALNLLAPKARAEWLEVWEKLQGTLGISELFITNGEEEYKSDPSSLQLGILWLACPPGKQVSSANNLLCGKLVLK